MSPGAARHSECASSFPRVSGDEPQGEVTEAMEMAFSPRERG